MANLTISVDPAILKRARIRAAQRGESVNAYLAQMLRSYADAPDQDPVFDDVAAVPRAHQGSRSSGTRWRRDKLHRV